MRSFRQYLFVTAAISSVAGAGLLGSVRPSAAAPPNPAVGQAAAPPCGGDGSLRSLFKGAPAGMKVKDKIELYDEQGLFNYIDGGAPLYVKHHFRKLGAAELVSAEGGELTCDIYDMSEASNAAAVFAAEKSATFKPVAGWSQAASGPLFFIFQEACYYVKLTAFDKKAESALPKLASALRDRIKGRPLPPARK